MVEDWKIEVGPEGSRAEGESVVQVAGGKMFKRNAKRLRLSDNAEEGHVRILVVELGGVRVYVGQANGKTNILVTKEDMYP